MNLDSIAYALLFAWCGFLWGRWWEERRPRRTGDPALRMLSEMFTSILERRRIVGRAMTISSTHHIEIMGEKISIILEAKGDPHAFIEGEVVR